MKNTKQQKNTTPPILLARFRFHKINALLKAHQESKSPSHKGRKLKFSEPALSQPLGCPLCSEPLVVFRRPLGDEWAYCPGCGFADDVPGTVAVSLGCTLEEAIDFLVFQHNLHHVPKKDTEQYLVEKARYIRFTDLLTERLYRNYSLDCIEEDHGIKERTLDHLLGTLNLRPYIGGESDFVMSLVQKDRIREPVRIHHVRESDPRQRDHSLVRPLPSEYKTDFFGFAYYHVIESWFFPKLYDPATSSVWANTSPNRLFRGRGWDLVLVIPLQDVPGHFCGCLFVGRSGVYPDDYVLRLLPDYGRSVTNTGFIMPFRAFQTMQKLKNKEPESGKKRNPFMIAYNNPLHLIRTIIQNSRGFGTPPMVGWVDYFENASQLKTSDWSAFSDIKNKVFWVHCNNIKTMRTIVEQNGKVLFYNMKMPYPGVEELRVLGKPTFRPNSFAVARMEIDGTHWRKYYAERFQYLAPQEAIEELRQVTLNQERFETCLARLPSTPEIKRIRRLYSKKFKSERPWIGQYELFEEPTGWFRKTERQLSPQLVADVRCYIDQIHVCPLGKKSYYCGRIVYGERTIKFRVRIAHFDKAPITCIRLMFRKLKLPQPIFYCKNRFYKAAVFALSKMKLINLTE